MTLVGPREGGATEASKIRQKWLRDMPVNPDDFDAAWSELIDDVRGDVLPAVAANVELDHEKAFSSDLEPGALGAEAGATEGLLF